MIIWLGSCAKLSNGLFSVLSLKNVKFLTKFFEKKYLSSFVDLIDQLREIIGINRSIRGELPIDFFRVAVSAKALSCLWVKSIGNFFSYTGLEIPAA